MEEKEKKIGGEGKNVRWRMRKKEENVGDGGYGGEGDD